MGHRKKNICHEEIKKNISKRKENKIMIANAMKIRES